MTADDRPAYSVVKTAIRNRRRRPMKIALEPWGEEYDIPAGATVQVLARGPEGDSLEIWRDDERVTVYAWPGATVVVTRNGIDIAKAVRAATSSRQTAPFLPRGMRMREWVEASRT